MTSRLNLLLPGSGLLFMLLGCIWSSDLLAQGRPPCVGARLMSDARLVQVTNPTVNSLRFEDNKKLELKVTSRKPAYRTDELVTLDIALLNRSDESLYAFRPSIQTVGIKALDHLSRPVSITNFESNLVGYSTAMYAFIPKGGFIVGQVNVLVGCEHRNRYVKNRVDRFNSLIVDDPDNLDRIMFEEGLFLSWGDYCLDIENRGEIQFSLELKPSMHLVAYPKCKDLTRTVIPSLQTKPYSIRIIE